MDQVAIIDLAITKQAIDEAIKRLVWPSEIANMCCYAVAGGQRLRPLALLLIKNLGIGKDWRLHDDIPPAAIAVELLHKASLLQDDLVDRDNFRRSRETFHKRFGELEAVLIADYLVARAFEMAAQCGSPKIYTEFAHTFAIMSLGETLDAIGTDFSLLTKERVLEITSCKTATLVSLCCRIGAILAGASELAEHKAAAFGENIGMSFQLQNDLNNFEGREEPGRNPGSDLDLKRPTLPAYLWNQLPPDRRDSIAKAGIVESVRGLVQSYREAAIQELGGLGKKTVEKILMELGFNNRKSHTLNCICQEVRR